MKSKVPSIFALTFLTVGQAQENYTQWSSYKTLTLNTAAAAVATDQINFPVLVRLNTGDADVFAGSHTKGADLRFTKSDGATRFAYQIERWDSAGQAAEIWVKVDTVKGNSTTQTFRMYWGNAAAADSSSGKAVFDTANGFQAVWHLNEATGAVAKDATANGYDATPKDTLSAGLPADTAGPIGRGKSFAGAGANQNTAGGYFEVANSAAGKLNLPQDGQYTVSAWIYDANFNNAYHTVLSKNNFQYSMEAFPSNEWGYAEYNEAGTGTNGWQSVRFNGVSSSWTYLVAVRNGVSETLYMNVNGATWAISSQNDSLNNAARQTGTDLCLGRRGDFTAADNRFWDGLMDEVRISTTARSADWIKLEYSNQQPTQSVVTLGATNTQTQNGPSNLSYSQNPAVYAVGTAITSNLPTVTGAVTHYSVSPALPAGLTLDTVSGAITGTPTTALAAANYTVTAANSSGSTTVALRITTVASITAPSNLNYRRDSLNLTERQTISADTPTVTGAVTHYAVTPALPGGLQLDSVSGILSGTPANATASGAYIITAGNSAGSAADTLTITVQLAPPSNLIYPIDSADFAVGQSISPDIPTLSGSATDFTVDPPLPAGLTLDAASGMIWGSPASADAPTNYTVTASNSAGSTHATLRLAVGSATGLAMGNSGETFRVLLPFAMPIDFQLPADGVGGVSLFIVDTRGRKIWSRTVDPSNGIREIDWNGNSVGGIAATRGIYIARVTLEKADGKAVAWDERKVIFIP